MSMRFIGTELESCSESTAAACVVASSSGDQVCIQNNAQQFHNDSQTKEAFQVMNDLRK